MIDEYIKALKAGEKEYKARLAAGEYPYLPALDDICPDHDIIIMSDEAHRSQYGIYADNMMKLLPTASRIGFTGTPLLSDTLFIRRASSMLRATGFSRIKRRGLFFIASSAIFMWASSFTAMVTMSVLHSEKSFCALKKSLHPLFAFPNFCKAC